MGRPRAAADSSARRPNGRLKLSDVAKWPAGREKRVDFIQRTWCFMESSEAGVDDHVLDGVVAENNRLAELEGLVAEHKIVGAIVGGDFESAHLSDGRTAKSHRGTEHELHAFHGARSQNARGHFDGHSHGFKPGPNSALDRDAAIRAGEPADSRVGEGQRDGAQIIGRDADVAVADDENVVRGGGFHQLPWMQLWR